MKKLIEYPSQALGIVHEGQLMVLISNDVEKVANALYYIAFLAVGESTSILSNFLFPSIRVKQSFIYMIVISFHGKICHGVFLHGFGDLRTARRHHLLFGCLLLHSPQRLHQGVGCQKKEAP